MRIRPADPGDAAAMATVATAAEEEPRGAEAPRVPDATLVAYLAHVVHRGRAAVSEAVDGAIVGFGAAMWNGRAQHLADLFVLPVHQGRGLGRGLIEAVLGDERPLTTYASEDPRALPLYLRAGMGAWWPNLYLGGDPGRIPAGDAGLEVVDASLADVADLERRWCGVDRGPDLDYFATLAGVQPFAVRRGVRTVGAGLARDRLSGSGRWVDQAVAMPGEDGPAILLAAMRATLAGAGAGGACVPGPSPLVRTLLEAGFTIRDRDTFLASDISTVDPEREIVNLGLG